MSEDPCAAKRQRVSSFNMDSGGPAHRLRKESLGSLRCPIRSERKKEYPPLFFQSQSPLTDESSLLGV